MQLRLSRCGFVAASFLWAWNLPVLWAQNPGDLVAITPCRVVDTRGANGPLGGPTMMGGTTRVFPIPSGPCSVPSNAVAYSLNIAVVPQGPLHYLTAWPDGVTQPLVSTLNDSSGLILSNAATVEAGNNGAIDVYVTNTTDVIIDIYGYFVPQTNSADESTGLGGLALSANTGTYNSAFGFNSLTGPSGSFNTALGALTLSTTSTGANNTAVGYQSLYSNTTGSGNAAVGFYALQANTTGSYNEAMGNGALLQNTTGDYNLAIGYAALHSNSSGIQNQAIGDHALFNATGDGNLALGSGAGSNVVDGSQNIEIGNPGARNDSGVIRIGQSISQTQTFIAGINNSTVTGAAVVVDMSTGQLGVAPSSARYKEDIHDLGESSDALMQLRPVTFRYKQAAGDGTKPVQYGLIAEEVAKIYPELVIHDRNGQVQSVQYLQLPALLLNEVQKQHKTIQELEARIAALEDLLQGRVQSSVAAEIR